MPSSEHGAQVRPATSRVPKRGAECSSTSRHRRRVKVGDPETLRRVAGAYASIYDWHVAVRDGAFHDTEGALTAGPPPYDVYEVVPATAFAFGTDESFRPTRW